MKRALTTSLITVALLSGCDARSNPSAHATPQAPSAGSLVAAGAGEAVAGTTPESPAASAIGNDAANPTIEPGRFFNSNSPWNTAVAGLPVQSGSQALLAAADGPQSGGTPGLFINTTSWTTPIVSTAGGVPTRVWCRQYACGSDAASFQQLDVPADASPDPRYDGLFTIVDLADREAYDLWRARRQSDGSISYETVKIWALDGLGYSAPSVGYASAQTSARGSGLPLFAGLITQPELAAGLIAHALAIGVPAPANGNYVQPASATDGTGPTWGLPEGARLVLRPGVRVSTPQGANAAYVRTILTALSTYGAIVVERSSVPTLYAQASATQLLGNELEKLTLADFQVIALPQRHSYGPAGGEVTP